MEVYPSLAFDSLSSNHGSQRPRAFSTASASTPRRSPPGQPRDQAKLDEYLHSVRDVEKQLERTRSHQAKAMKRRESRPPGALMPRPDNGLPEDIREHMS
jgi:hypothetical protein